MRASPFIPWVVLVYIFFIYSASSLLSSLEENEETSITTISSSLRGDEDVSPTSAEDDKKHLFNEDIYMRPDATLLDKALQEGEKPRSTVEDPVGPGLQVRRIEADVLVAGGGSAGTSTALAAARGGAKTVIVQSRGVLGGNASSEAKLHMVGADREGHRGKNLETEAREGGIVEEYTLKNSVMNPQRSGEMHDLTLFDLLHTQENLTLLLNTYIVSAVKEQINSSESWTVTKVLAENQETQIQYEIYAKVFVDATGDGRLGAEADIPYIIGREGVDRFKESLADRQDDNETMGSSLAFTSKNYGIPMSYTPPTWAKKYNVSDWKYRPIRSNSLEYGYWFIEVAWPYNMIRDNEEVKIELLSSILGTWDYIKNSGNYPEAANLMLDWIEWWPCKREGRRFSGQYIMTQNDMLPDPLSEVEDVPPPKLFWDRLAYGGWNLDLHSIKGILDTSRAAYASYYIPYLYSTPLRSFIATNATNVMLSGRLASFSHIVFGSQRVMKTCAHMGQAVGTAAAYAVLHDLAPSELKDHPEAVWAIQQRLLRDDHYIIGLYNEDPDDLALTAQAEASSETEGSVASNVLSGQTRAVDGDGGAHSSQRINGTNRWMSKPGAIPAWISLTWKASLKDLAQIEIIFDTGMHRTLMMTQKLSDLNRMVWGRPQPETVANYTVQAKLSTQEEGVVEAPSSSNEWIDLVTVTDNFLRKRVHNVQEVMQQVQADKKQDGVSAIRVLVNATHGVPEARIVEIRVYDNKGASKNFATAPPLDVLEAQQIVPLGED